MPEVDEVIERLEAENPSVSIDLAEVLDADQARIAAMRERFAQWRAQLVAERPS